jgi:hypothetical protein
MKKSFTIKKNKNTKYENIDILMNYLIQSKGRLQTKERKPFTGGLKNHTFILPQPNPKAKPVIF